MLVKSYNLRKDDRGFKLEVGIDVVLTKDNVKHYTRRSSSGRSGDSG